MLGSVVQIAILGESPWENGEGAEVPGFVYCGQKNIFCLWLCSEPRFNNKWGCYLRKRVVL